MSDKDRKLADELDEMCGRPHMPPEARRVMRQAAKALRSQHQGRVAVEEQ